MSGDWHSVLAERLVTAANDAGAWGYRPGSSGSAEPTALAALALATTGRAPERITAALGWLARLQRRDGAIPISAAAASPRWPTALALLAWLRAAPYADNAYGPQAEKAATWLINTRGQKVSLDTAVYDHDTTLVGWPWVAGSHSWIEPTAYAILALRAAGRAEHPRVREGVELILDRALLSGGWNYGNRRVLEHVLRPFPATTGVALAALAGEPREECIDGALKYLTAELRRVHAPLSLAWGLIGMRAWDAQPLEAQTWLDECAQRLMERPAAPLYDALLLLAGADSCLLIGKPEVQADD